MPNEETSVARRILSSAEKHPLVAIAIFVLLALGPFLNKAVHIDDALFVWSAEQIVKHPGDFYGFNVNWYGDTDSMSAVNCNPPTTSYLLAGVMAIFSEREIFLHGAMLLIAFAAAAGVFQLARLWCERPLLAAFIALSTPVFLVSATTLMCDVPMLAAWIWAVVFWERALKNVSWSDYFLGALLAGLAVLTKYSALTLLPLLPILGVLRRRSIGSWLLWLAVPAAMIALYQLGTARLYGHGLITAAVNYASQTRFGITGGWLNKFAIGLAYLGGCLLPVLFFLPWLWTKRELIIGGGIVLAAASMIVFGTGIGHQFGLGFQLQMALLLANGIHLLLLAFAELWRRHDAVSWTLACWLGSGIIFAAVLNWTVSARSFLPLAPVAAILMARAFNRIPSNRESHGIILWPIAISTAISLIIAIADFQLANSDRVAARQLAAKFSSSTDKISFQGHCGFQFYYGKSGAQPVEFSRSIFAPGDIMIVPSNNSNLVMPEAGDVETAAVLEFSVCSWLSTVQAATGAGFYGAGGLLPFVFGSVPPEKYFIFRVTRTMSFAPPESLNNLAWNLATSPDPKIRDGAQAVWLAQRACELTKYQKAVCIGTLAAAQAETGKFDQAIATAQRACAVASQNGETNLVQSNERLIERYRAHKTATE